MKRLLLIPLILALALMGCGPSKNQLAAEQSFYNAKIAMSQRLSSQPIFEMTAGDPTQPIVLQNVSALRVYQLPAVGAGLVRMGYVTATKSDGNFTFGTTALNVANSTVAYTSTAAYTAIYNWIVATGAGIVTTN